MATVSGQNCPCGSGRCYPACCGYYHGGALAPTAEALMRSRYTAYTLGLWDYLRATWHEATCPERIDGDAQPVVWLGLSVKRATRIDDRHATVEFVARYKVNGRAFRLHETSRFVHENGRWFYVDGHFPER